MNGPEGILDWDTIDWRTHEQNVVRLRRRIFKATREGDWATVRSLQKMMLRSWSNTLVSVRQVTQRNTGRRTAGIDGEVALTSQARAEAAVHVHRTRASWDPLPVRRVHIPKAKGKLRPLGIPVIMDRCHQARVRHALEPEWEARFEPRSYGFRPGRSCADAIDTLFVTLRGPRANRVWILDADLSAAFDNINHEQLLDALGGFPARDLIARWLKAGVIEGEMFTPTDEGSPQGGVISPLLMNVALHGLEEAAGVRYRMTGVTAGRAREGTPVLVRYADDLVVCCYSEQEAYRVKQRLAQWLEPRGLVFNEDKTKVIHAGEGFDFLGFSVRRYSNGKLLIKPSRDAVKRIRKRLTDETRRMRGSSVRELISRLNPIIRGWAAYYRGVVAAQIFNELDHHVWWLTWRWAVHQHPNKSKKWIKRRYFGKHNRFRDDHWVFGEQVGDHARYLVKFSWTPIVRHQLVRPGASPDDPDLIEYWAKRRRKVTPPLDDYNLALLTKQDGRCPLCGEHLLTADQPPQSPNQWERWWLGVARRAIAADYLTHERHGTPDGKRTRMVHTSCYRSLRARNRRRPATFSPAEPSGLA
ncbi:group II intron reverse transcriptase/maturase [Nonomuraea sp. B19D2]|uniref:group II intron reverse transcriptase/maturase n=1 Tax=Nonomuraea sp. B19D2 TaxID=3159561 RepID=UPI0032DAFE65